jgi:inositol-phosphate phosphatase/L-galactose 1-phosphate phosphatase/histidinol-phosphatase
MPAAPAVETCPAEFVALAHRLADAAGEAIRRRFRTRVEVDVKADESPVTLADREAEAVMRELIEAAYPDHGIIGEEFGARAADAEHVWVLDPIDGTRAFITGRPTFGTLIGLARAGRPLLGVIDQPITGERWLAGAGITATLDHRPIAARQCGDLADAILYTTGPEWFEGADETAFLRLRDAVRMTLYNADCYAFGLLAAGFVDLVVEAKLQVYDYWAVIPVVEEAGGVITDWQGAPLALEGDGTVLAAGDRAAHRAALELLNR